MKEKGMTLLRKKIRESLCLQNFRASLVMKIILVIGALDALLAVVLILVQNEFAGNWNEFLWLRVFNYYKFLLFISSSKDLFREDPAPMSGFWLVVATVVLIAGAQFIVFGVRWLRNPYALRHEYYDGDVIISGLLCVLYGILIVIKFILDKVKHPANAKRR